MTAARYEFGSSAEDRTFVMGLRGSQVALLAFGLVFAVALVRASGGSAGSFAVAAGAVALAACAAVWPVQGRTADEWAPVLIRSLFARLGHRDTYLSSVPILGLDASGEPVQQPPPTLRGVELLAARLDGSAEEIGILHDRYEDAYTALLAVRGSSFQLADNPDRERRLSAWGSVLAGLARASSPIHRIQWIERTAVEDADEMGRYLAEAVAVPRSHAALASYLDVVEQAGPVAPAHESFLTVSISGRELRRSSRRDESHGPVVLDVLVRELRHLQRQLAGADLVVEGMLTPRMVASVLRTAFDPFARPGLARRAAASKDEQGTQPGNAWPLATQTAWSSYRSGDVCHSTYWIAQWPRSAVGADFLTPLLVGTTVMRTVSLTMQPISPLRAHRDVEHAVLKGQADEELRARAGFATTARRRRAQETAARRERELADGHADYRLAGYVTVTAGSSAELSAACSEVEQAAHQSGLELRRLDGQQDVAFTWTLPLGRGLR